MIKHNATVDKITYLTPDTIQIDFIADKDFNFKTGQFISIDIPEQEKPLVRSYSIASSDKKLPSFTLCIKIVEDGMGSNYLAHLNIKDKITFAGPFGHFVLSDNRDKDKLFIATGTGLAPIHGMIMKLHEENFQGKCNLFFGVRYEEDLFYIDGMEVLKDSMKNFDYSLAVSRMEEEREDIFRGRVTEYLKSTELKDFNDSEFYICGNKEMIKEVREILLEEGFEKQNIFSEQFY